MPRDARLRKPLTISTDVTIPSSNFRYLSWSYGGPFVSLNRPTRVLIWFVLILLAMRCVASAVVPLMHQEAYYWMYAQHPSLSYYDHPPMVAWVIGFGTKIFGNTEWGVRVVGGLLMLLNGWLIYEFARAWWGKTVGANDSGVVRAVAGLFRHWLPGDDGRPAADILAAGIGRVHAGRQIRQGLAVVPVRGRAGRCAAEQVHGRVPHSRRRTASAVS